MPRRSTRNHEYWLAAALALLLCRGHALSSETQPGKPAPQVSIPAHVYVAAGHEFNLWFDNLRPAETRTVRVSVQSTVGASASRAFRYVPESNDVNRTFPITVRVTDTNENVAHERSFTLHVTPANGGRGTPQILFLGDSLTHGVPCRGMISGEAKRLLETDGFRPVLLGRDDDKGDNRHEGLGGWSFHSFATGVGKCYRFDVSGIRQFPLSFSAYRHAGLTYRVQSRNLAPCADGRLNGSLFCSVRGGDNPGLARANYPSPCSTGVLTRIHHSPGKTGDATIAFAAVEHPVPSNPFWDNTLNNGKGGLHLRKYMSDYRYFGGADRIDFACIQLGVNDCFGVTVGKEEQTQMRLDAILRYAKTLVRGIQDPVYGYPDCRVILALTPIGCNSPDAYVRSYGAQCPHISMARYESIVRTLWDLLIREFDGTPDWPGVRLSINGLMTDRDKGYPRREMLIDGVKTMEHSNAVHPNNIGYRQCAAAYYSVLRGWLAEDE